VAGPEANGFYNSKGISRWIPNLYSSELQNVYKEIQQLPKTPIHLYEYTKAGWTFHAKGLWLFTPQSALTVVGSSNFSYRSLYLDLESQIILITNNKDLMERLRQERDGIFQTSLPVSAHTFQDRNSARQLPLTIKLLSGFIKKFM